jgi:hypothetical protein
MKKNIILMITLFLFSGCTITPLIANGTKNGEITILEQKNLLFSDKNGIPFEGISDMAFDSKMGQLYMVGDRGYLYSFSAKFGEKIEKLSYLNAFHIKTGDNKTIHPDIEGLTFTPDGRLIASFERYPRVKWIGKDGRLKLNYRIPKKLRKVSIYKSKNGIFEAVAYHPKYGLLVVAEYPINRQKKQNQTIYALNGKKEWHFKAQPYPNSAITALEIMEDNNILILERAYSGLTKPFYVTLKKVYINRCNKKQECKSEVLATFSSSDGWGYNNFEGLARVGKNRYIMISDNNGHLFIPTVLSYFKIKE